MAEFVNPLAVAGETYGYLEGVAQDAARRRAGQALSAGDSAGATNALYARGLLGEGSGVEAMQQGQEDRASQLAAGQRKQQQADFKNAGDFLLKATEGLLQTYRSPEDAQARYQQSIRPVLLQMGNPEMDKLVQQIDSQGAAAFSREGLQQFHAQFGGEQQKVQGVNLGGGGFATFDPVTGQFEVLREPPINPLEEQLLQARIDATRAQVGQRDAAAAKARRTPVVKKGGAAAAKLPTGFILDGN